MSFSKKAQEENPSILHEHSWRNVLRQNENFKLKTNKENPNYKKKVSSTNHLSSGCLAWKKPTLTIRSCMFCAAYIIEAYHFLLWRTSGWIFTSIIKITCHLLWNASKKFVIKYKVFYGGFLSLSLSVIFSQNRANIGHLGERLLLQALLHEQNTANNRIF